MTNKKQHPLPRKEFDLLAKAEHEYCVSIYLPMDLKGKEQNQHLAQGRLKQCLKEGSRDLASRGMPAREVENYLQPAEALLTDVELWRNPSEGLALFMSPDTGFKRYLIPIAPTHQTYVGGRFLLSPLLPLYHNNGNFYLLELSQDYVGLYEGSRYHFSDLYLEDVAPAQLEDAVGFDYEQKNLQFRSGQSGQGANFHGHGAGKDDEQKEILAFFRKIDEGVHKKIGGKEAPLLLSCVDALAPLYRKVNSYKAIFPKHISGDPEFKNDDQRQKESWALLQPFFEELKMQKKKQYEASFQSGKGSADPVDVLAAAHEGRVDTLFIRKGAILYGNFDPQKQTVSLQDERTEDNTSLTDLAGLQTFLQGGKVFFLPQEQMPVRESPINAIFRF